MKKCLAFLISIIPFNILRVFLYNTVMGYDISYSSRIGIGTIIVVHKAVIERAYIKRFNKISGCFDLVIGDESKIGSSNEFACTSGSAGIAFLKIGKNVHITNNHFFDTSGGITINDFTRIAGRGSQFWTHGGHREKAAIVINEKCYVGSAVRFSQGVELAVNSFVGLGSVVIDAFNSPNVLILGCPARVVKNDIIARTSLAEL